jgi:hypothetical protein
MRSLLGTMDPFSGLVIPSRLRPASNPYFQPGGAIFGGFGMDDEFGKRVHEELRAIERQDAADEVAFKRLYEALRHSRAARHDGLSVDWRRRTATVSSKGENLCSFAVEKGEFSVSFAGSIEKRRLLTRLLR